MNSFDNVQCEEMYSDADHVSEMELLDAAEFFDSMLAQMETDCTSGEVCGWIPCQCHPIF
jgi:hypothetical protein